MDVSAGVFPSKVSKETLFVYPGKGEYDKERGLRRPTLCIDGLWASSLSPLSVSDIPRRDGSRLRADLNVCSDGAAEVVDMLGACRTLPTILILQNPLPQKIILSRLLIYNMDFNHS